MKINMHETLQGGGRTSFVFASTCVVDSGRQKTRNLPVGTQWLKMHYMGAVYELQGLLSISVDHTCSCKTKQAFTGEFSFGSMINSPGTFKESSRRAL